MKGLRTEQLENKLLLAIKNGDDAAARIIENRILKKEKKKDINKKNGT